MSSPSWSRTLTDQVTQSESRSGSRRACNVPSLGQYEVVFTTSIGIALSSPLQKQPADLLRHADLAMYRAKHKGKARYEVFEPGMGTNALERLRLENELRRALERGEFKVYYQPVVALEGGRIVGAEALVRWEHPIRGLLLPEEFLSVAEETGLIAQIGEKVLREACHQVRAWQVRYPGEPPNGERKPLRSNSSVPS